MSNISIDDATNVNYSPKDYTDIYKKYLENAYTEGIISNAEDALDYLNNGKDIENTMILEYSNHALIVRDIYVDLTRIYKSHKIATATGTDLDDIGSIYFLRRLADYSITDVIVTAEEVPTDNIYIPLGTVVTNKDDNSVEYRTTEDKYIVAGTNTVTIPVKSTIIGPVGNVPAHYLNSINGTYGVPLAVDNQYDTSGGVNDEDDEAYRTRLGNWKYILRKGTPDAIINAVTDVSAVVGYFLDKLWDGAGTTKIIIDPPVDTVINLVNASLEGAKAVDEDILVEPVESEPLNLTAEAQLGINSNTVLDDIQTQQLVLKTEQAIKTYINGGTNYDGTSQAELGIGKDFIPFKCSVYCANQIPELDTLVFTYPTSIVPVSSNQKLVAGDITVNVV